VGAPGLANEGMAPSSSAVGARIEASKAPRDWDVGRGVWGGVSPSPLGRGLP